MKSCRSKLEKFRDVSDFKKCQKMIKKNEKKTLFEYKLYHFKEFELYKACFASQSLMFKSYVSS